MQQHDLYLDKSFVLNWIKKTKPPKQKKRHQKTFRFIDLFAGCGGLSYGLLAAAQEPGYSALCALAIDTNKSALEVYKKNIPHEENSIVNNDILNLFNSRLAGRLTKEEKSLKEKIGKIDFLVAGPPCQGHSDLNNSTRRNDPRNSLYLACTRAVEIFSPNLVIIENVPTVIHSSEGVVQTTEKRLIKQGYFVNSMTINFLNLGIPQARRRHVLIATKESDFCEKLCNLSIKLQTPTLREFIEDIKLGNDIMDDSGKLSAENRKRVDVLFQNNLFNLPNKYRPSCHREKRHSYNSVYGRLNYDQPAQTITSGYGSMGQGRYIHPDKRRTINSREASRIQGFPDYYDFSQANKITELRRMIANAVPPQLSYKIASLYIKHEMKSK